MIRFASHRAGSTFYASQKHCYSTLNAQVSPTSRYLRTAKYLSILGFGGLFTYYYALDSRAAIHRYIVMPVVRLVFDAEQSHKFTLLLAKNGWLPTDRVADDPCLETQLFGLKLSNPVGLGAGFDKNAEAMDGLFSLGFGLVEVGTITPEPQPGNLLPRLFRLEEDLAAINRYGFNSVGQAEVHGRLRSRIFSYLRNRGFPLSTPLDDIEYKSLKKGHALGVNLGKNKWSEPSSNSDYVSVLESLGSYADYLVINVSSPNTPGLRDLQKKEILEKLITKVKTARDSLPLARKPPLLLKIAPDLTQQELSDIASLSLSLNLDGVIISNTTVQRPPGLRSDPALISQTGGLSGKPLMQLSLPMVSQFYKLTEGKIPIIGCGGISTGEDAVKYLEAGASALQIYTAVAYEGPAVVREIKDHLVETCRKRGFKNVSELVGKRADFISP